MQEGPAINPQSNLSLAGVSYVAGGLTFLALVLANMLGIMDPDPLENTLKVIGDLAFALMFLCLSITPLMNITGRKYLFPLRRSLGLLSFAFALAHAILYGLSVNLEVSIVLEDFAERSHLTLGIIALFILAVLALSSNIFAKRLLRKRWYRLHKLVYLALILTASHYIMATKILERDRLLIVLLSIVVLSLRLGKVSKFLRSFPSKEIS